ncbi:MAG: extracellular solute-binding protein family 1 [Paenibacillaceae bacterium]|jgi:multiple sugar transport system substrate-binding protein|nr:extracellular solute-binding protein family 1 [Paenibacillaceae bacterium]
MLLPLVLSACGSGTATTGGSAVDDSAKGASTVKEEGPVDLHIYATSSFTLENYNDKYGDLIQKKFPNYKITYHERPKDYTVDDLVAAKPQIDIMIETAGTTSPALFYDMGDLIKKHKVDLGSFDQTMIDLIKQLGGGKIFGLPVNSDNMVTYYNKGIFDKFGMPYPKDGMTWDDAIALSDKLTRSADGTIYFGLAVADKHYFQENQFGLPFLDPKTGKATINNENWKKILETVFAGPAKSQIYREGMNGLKGKLPGKDQLIKDKTLAMFVENTGVGMMTSIEAGKVDWDMVSMPTFKDLPKIGSQGYPTYLAITPLAKFPDAAMEVIKYATSAEFQTANSRKGLPTVLNDDNIKKQLGQDTPFKGKHFAAAFFNKPAPIAVKSEFDDDILKIYIQQEADLALGKVDVNTLLRTAEEQANKKADELKKK